MPDQLRILEVTAGEAPDAMPAWVPGAGGLADALQMLCPSGSPVAVAVARGDLEGINRLREERFDAVLFHHRPPEHHALEFLKALRGTGIDEPVIILMPEADEDLLNACFPLGGDGQVAKDGGARPHALARLVWRAIQRRQLDRENRRLKSADHRRMHAEHGETQRHVESLRQILSSLKRKTPQADAEEPAPLSPALEPASPLAEFQRHYGQLLRLYVIMGAGSLSAELGEGARSLAAANVTVSQLLELHLDCLTRLLESLGAQGRRHITARADLLLLELLAHLAHARQAAPVDRRPLPVGTDGSGVDQPTPTRSSVQP